MYGRLVDKGRVKELVVFEGIAHYFEQLTIILLQKVNWLGIWDTIMTVQSFRSSTHLSQSSLLVLQRKRLYAILNCAL